MGSKPHSPELNGRWQNVAGRDDEATGTDGAVATVRRWWWWAVAAVLALLAGAGWWFAPWHAARPITVTGTAYSDYEQSAIGFDVDSKLDALRFGLSDEGEGFDLEGAAWAGTDNVWHQGAPVECLRRSEATRIELSFVEISYGSNDSGGYTRLVTAVRCLE